MFMFSNWLEFKTPRNSSNVSTFLFDSNIKSFKNSRNVLYDLYLNHLGVQEMFLIGF